MSQLRLFPHLCAAEDDAGVKCRRSMSEEEVEQDGMCSRCANLIWDSMKNDTQFFYSEGK